MKYSHQDFVFCKVNVDQCPKAAKQMKINAGGFSRQLPSLILFKNFKELKRFPAIVKDGTIGKVLKYDGKKLEKFFELKEAYMEVLAFKNPPTKNSR